MTAKTRAVLKTAFETGDTPDGNDYGDMIDSFVNVTDSTAQAIQSDFRAANVSADGDVKASANVIATDASIANAITCSALTVDGAPVFGEAYGQLYVAASGVATVASAGQHYVPQATTSAPSLSGFVHTSPFRLTYSAGPTRRFVVHATLGIEIAGTADVASLAIMKDGVAMSAEAVTHLIGASAQVHNMSIVGIATLASAGYVEIGLANTTDTGNLHVETGTVVVHPL